MRFSLKNKIIVTIVSLILLFGSISTYAVFLMTKNNLISLEKRNIIEHVESQNGEIKNTLFFSSELVRSVATNLEVISIMESNNFEEEEIEHLTEHFLRTYNVGNMYSAIYIMNKDGLTIASTDTSFVGKNYGFREYFINSMAGQSYTDFSVGSTSKKAGYYFSHPVKTSDGEIIGVVVVKMKPDIITSFFDHVDFDKMKMMLLDSYGVIVFSTDESKNFYSLGKILDSDFDNLKEKRYGGIEIKEADYPEVQAGLSELKEDGTLLFEIFDDIDDEAEYVVVSKVGNFPFYVMAEIELNEIVNLSIRSSSVIASLVLLAALIVGVMNSILVNRFLLPLDKLRKVTEKISDGDLSERIEIKSEDELGLLAKSFNKMMDSVIKARADVDIKVKEQTKELAIKKEEAEKAMRTAEEVSFAMSGREIKMMELKEEINKLKSKK